MIDRRAPYLPPDVEPVTAEAEASPAPSWAFFVAGLLAGVPIAMLILEVAR